MDVREKLVELLSKYFNIGDSYAYNLTRVKSAFVGLDDFEEFDEETVSDIADHLIAHGVTIQEWIPVKDRLPDVGKFVLIYNEINGVLLDYHDGATFGYYDVTHWMPLPNPPKGE